jgi:hypothetical protein
LTDIETTAPAVVAEVWPGGQLDAMALDCFAHFSIWIFKDPEAIATAQGCIFVTNASFQ